MGFAMGDEEIVRGWGMRGSFLFATLEDDGVERATGGASARVSARAGATAKASARANTGVSPLRCASVEMTGGMGGECGGPSLRSG